MTSLRVLCIGLAALSLTLVACDDGGGDNGGTDTGADVPVNTTPDRYFRGSDSAALGASGNQADCAHCHSIDGTQVGFSGYPLNDSAYLDNFKGGGDPTFLDATNFCLTDFMGADPGFGELREDDPQYVSLLAYIESISDDTVTTARPEEPEVLADAATYEATYSGGDAIAGEAAFNTWCAKCHRPADNPSQTFVVGPNAAVAVSVLASYEVADIAQQVRTSTSKIPSSLADEANGEDLTVGYMPFFLPNILLEEDLRNIIAYIQTQ